MSLSESGIYLPNGRDQAFLSYGGNCRDFTLGNTYEMELMFLVTYYSIIQKKDGSSEKFWASFWTKSYDDALSHPEYKRMGLSEDKIVPYFEIRK